MENMKTNQEKITDKDIKRVSKRWIMTSQITWNYERMMGIGYLYAILPVLRKLYKDPDKMAGNVKIILKDMVLENLLDAFANLLCRVERKEENKEPKKIIKDRFTVAEKIVAIKSIIREKKHIKFTDLFEADHTKSEMLNIFLALLELLKLQFVKAKQTEIFGEIDIYENEEKAINE